MGMFDWLTGRKRPAAGVIRRSAAEVRAALLAINRDTAPFQIRDGAPEGVDLVAEWKLVDAKWYEIFAKAGLTRVFKVLLRFDAVAGEVRALDQEWRVDWRAGVPETALAVRGFRGRRWEMSFERAYAFREDLSFGEVYDYTFVSEELKAPLREAALAAGWGWRAVAFGKL